MVPPRLTLVSDNTRDKNEAAARADAEAVEDREHSVPLSDPENAVSLLTKSAAREKLRRLEAMLFAASQPLDAKSLARCLDADDDVYALLIALQAEYKDR